jgi:hypothetical protein
VLTVGTVRPGKLDFLGLTGHLGSVGDVIAAPVVRWDAIWYLDIAEHGYRHTTEAAYFPFYPLLIRAVGFVTRSYIIAAALISLVAFFVALLLLHRLTALELGAPAASRTVLLLAFFPNAVVFSAGFTEALFLALSIGVFLAARQERWVAAGILGAAAAATRNIGVLLLIPALAFYLYGPRASPASAARRANGQLLRFPRHPYPLRRDAAWLALIPLGLGAYVLASQIILGDALASWHAEAFFQRSFAGPFSSVWRGLGDAGHVISAVITGHPTVAGLRKVGALLIALAALGAMLGVFRRLPPSYGLYTLATLTVALSTPQSGHPLSATPRYILAVFPLFMWLGWRIKDRRVMVVVTALFALGLIYISARFATWR